MTKNKKFRLTLCVSVLLIGLLPGGCGKRDSGNDEAMTGVRFRTLQDFAGTTVGVMSGSISDDLMSAVVSGCEFKYYDDASASLLALQSGMLDAAVADIPVGQLAVARQPDLAMFPETVTPDTYGLGLQKDSPLTDDISAIIERYTEDGTPEQVFDHPKTDRCRAFVHRLKTLHLDIDSKGFDFIGVAGDIDRFARKQLLGAPQSLKYQQIFEELCVTSILPTLPDGGCSLRFDALCSEDGSECEAVIRWNGEDFDPLTQGDKLSAALALSRTKSSAHAYADGVNTVTIVF